MTSPEVVFALAEGQNVFFADLARALVHELERLGAPARIVVGTFPEVRRGVVTVLLPPHEFVNLSGTRPPASILRRCVLVSAEQPASVFFPWNAELAHDAGAVLDINEQGVRAYEAAGVPARHLQLGYSAAWDRRMAVAERDIDVLFVGRATRRREKALASYADVLERFNCHLLLSDDSRPNVGSGVNFVAGEEKLRLLARSKVLLNVHGEGEPYFEWLRVAEAMSAGCAIVTEHATDLEPLRAGKDIVTGRLETLGLLAAWLADDEAARARVVEQADGQMRSHASLAMGAAMLLEAATSVDAGPLAPGAAGISHMVAAQMRLAGEWEPEPPLGDGVSLGEHRILRAAKRQHLELVGLGRRLAREELARRRPERPEPGLVEHGASPAWKEPGSPSVSVIVPVYNDEDVVTNALDSVLGSTTGDWEIVAVDDASGDRSVDVVLEWIGAHPERRAILVGHEVNCGLPRARNTGIAVSRAHALLMLDSDNMLRPLGMARLLRALDRDPGAAFAYGILERFKQDESEDLVSKFGWEPARLRDGNYIDALALIRKPVLVGLGGYSEDLRLALGLEDYDLWARMAEAGERGAFVRDFVARYRMAHSSMLSVTTVSFADARAAIAEHAPTLMHGITIVG